MKARLRLAIVPLLLVALPTPVAAQGTTTVNEGSWDAADVTTTCTTALNQWLCTYTYRSVACQESSVAGALVLPCDAYFSVKLTIQPKLNASGQRVGCMSVPLTATPAVFDYNSTYWEWDRNDTRVAFAAVNDGLVKITYSNGDQRWHWHSAVGATTTCASGGTYSRRVPNPGTVVVTGQL